MSIKIVVLGARENASWLSVFRYSLGGNEQNEIFVENEFADEKMKRIYDLVVIDADNIRVEKVELCIKDFRHNNSDVPIIVVTASPTWQRARIFFLAGVTDYIRKSLDGEKVSTIFTEFIIESNVKE